MKLITKGAVAALLSLFALTLTAPAEATGWGGPDKNFSLAFKPAVVSPGANPNLRVRIKNEMPDGNSSIGSVEVKLPPGFTVAGNVTFDPPYSGLILASNGWTKVYLKVLAPIKKGQSVFIKLPVNVAPTSTCSTNDFAGTEAWTGALLFGDKFKRVAPTALPADYAANTKTLAGFALAFVPPTPTSVEVNTNFNVTVKQTSACAGVSLPPVTVTLTGTPSASFVGSSGATGAGGQVTLTGNFTQIGSAASVTASAPGYASVTSAPFTVFAAGDLACDPDPTPDPATAPPAARFSGSPPGVTDPSQTAFVEGVRGPNKLVPGCTLVNYTFTNNITGTTNQADAEGKEVPPNGVSFVWDRAQDPNLTALYTAVFRSEYVDPVTFLPNFVTRVCKATGTTPCTDAQPVKTCVGTALVPASLPAGEKICLASETWTTVPAGDPYYCTDPPPVPGLACIQVRSTFIDIFDPVIIRNSR